MGSTSTKVNTRHQRHPGMYTRGRGAGERLRVLLVDHDESHPAKDLLCDGDDLFL